MIGQYIARAILECLQNLNAVENVLHVHFYVITDAKIKHELIAELAYF